MEEAKHEVSGVMRAPYLRDVLSFLPRKQIDATWRLVSIRFNSIAMTKSCPDPLPPLPRHRFGPLHIDMLFRKYGRLARSLTWGGSSAAAVTS